VRRSVHPYDRLAGLSRTAAASDVLEAMASLTDTPPETERGGPTRRRSIGPERTGRRAVVSGLGAVLALGCAATALASASEREAAQQRDRRAVSIAASALAGALQTVSSLRGVSGLATTGEVSEVAFHAFGAEVLSGQLLFNALAYSVVVPDADVARFEQSTGIQVRDTRSDGTFVPTVRRPTHLVVRYVHPLDSINSSLVGFDIASDEARAMAAERAAATGAPVLATPIRLANSARPGIFVTHAVRTPADTVIGYVSSGVAIDDLVTAARTAGAARDRLSLYLDGELLTGDGRGAAQSFETGGRTIMVRADDPDDVRLGLPLITAAGTLLLAGTVALLFRRDAALVAAKVGQAARHRAIAALGERLAAAGSVEQVTAEVVAHAGGIMGAAYVDVGVLDVREAGVLHVRHADRTTPEHSNGAEAVQSLASPTPLADCARERTTVSIESAEDYRRRYPDLAAGVASAGIAAAICVPLVFHAGNGFGAIEFAWTDEHSAGTDDTRTAVDTIAQLTARALERAVIAEAVQGGAARLRTLAQALAGARTAVDVAEVVDRHVPGALGARTATLRLETGDRNGTLEASVGDDVLVQPVVVEGHEPSAMLEVGWADRVALNPTVHAIAQTIADMIGQTLARARSYDQEHELVLELQRTLLPDPPAIAGLDVAVFYEPAATVLGLGGDWYDLIVSRCGRQYLVIGDVTGHGAQAVTLMAQVKAVMAELLRVDTAIDVVLDQATEMLAANAMYATAQVVEVDVAAATLRYVNAGHPYPLLRGVDGTVTKLTGGHRPLLGLRRSELRTEPPAIALAGFEPGDAILLYTDGLIERRHASLDEQIDNLAAVFAALDRAESAAATADSVVRSVRAADGDSIPNDDDRALVVVRRADSGTTA
jgi:serine phosphatase RsbU (regulator of sigma subunit)